jgi:hypothetical protein
LLLSVFTKSGGWPEKKRLAQSSPSSILRVRMPGGPWVDGGGAESQPMRKDCVGWLVGCVLRPWFTA